ncbi:BatA domain-containing protein [Arenimonas alkanexedens]
MSLGLLAPAGLWALAALALPLLVHLARREEQKPTMFAALRWLATRLKPRQRLRFEEWLLLALRLLLVLGLALLLAQPVLHGSVDRRPWLVVMPGADASQAPALPEDAQRRWLAPGFPPLETERPTQAGATASLLRQLDADLPAGTPVTVLATAAFDGADGALPRLSRQVDWRVVAGEPIDAEPAETAFALAVRHADPETPGLAYLRAAATAWQSNTDAEADVALADTALAGDTQHLVWLAPGPLPPAILRWVEAGGRALLSNQTEWPVADEAQPTWRDARGEARARRAPWGKGALIQLSVPLSPEALPELLEPDFPNLLRDLLQVPGPAPQRALASAYAPQPGASGFPPTPRDLVPPLLWMLLALFAIERWLATGRREARP